MGTMTNNRFPLTDEIGQAMKVGSTSIEGAEYVSSQVKKHAIKVKFLKDQPDTQEKLFSALDEYVKFTRFKFTVRSQELWTGKVVQASELQNFQNNIALDAAKNLAGKVTEVTLDYAVSAEGHYVRGYSADDGSALDSATVSSLDKLFNAWLASKGYVIKGGYIYDANDKVQDENTRIDPEVIKQLLADGSLEKFLEQKGIDADLREQTYPGEEEEEQIQQEVSEQIREVNEAIDAEVSPSAGAGESPSAGADAGPSVGAGAEPSAGAEAGPSAGAGATDPDVSPGAGSGFGH